MPKLAAIYSIFSLILFGALFAAFYITGLGAPSEDWSVPPPAPVADQEPAPPPDPLAAGLDYPSLQPGETYRVSHATKMYPEPAEVEPESLPARGYFTVETPADVGDRRWYRVTVSDGARDYSRFILAKDLNFKRVNLAKFGETSKEEQARAALEKFIAEGQARRERARALRPPPPPEPRTPETFDEWWSMTADRMGGATQATVVASAVAAAIGTALTIGSIITVISLRREHTWERPPTHDLDAEWEEAVQDDVHAENPGDAAERRW